MGAMELGKFDRHWRKPRSSGYDMRLMIESLASFFKSICFKIKLVSKDRRLLNKKPGMAG